MIWFFKKTLLSSIITLIDYAQHSFFAVFIQAINLGTTLIHEDHAFLTVAWLTNNCISWEIFLVS